MYCCCVEYAKEEIKKCYICCNWIECNKFYKIRSNTGFIYAHKTCYKKLLGNSNNFIFS